MNSVVVLICMVAIVSASVLPEQRVVGGSPAELGQFPYAVGLLTRINILLSSQCAGSLLSTRYILTSASCVNG